MGLDSEGNSGYGSIFCPDDKGPLDSKTRMSMSFDCPFLAKIRWKFVTCTIDLSFSLLAV